MSATMIVKQTDKGAVRFHGSYISRTGIHHQKCWTAWSEEHPWGYVFSNEQEAIDWLLKQ